MFVVIGSVQQCFYLLYN